MRGFKYTFIGFFGFLLVVTFNVSVGILIYSYIKDQSDAYVAILIILVIIVSSILCTIIDYFRRKIMIEKPLGEILFATKQMARGNFNIRLNTYHTNYDEFDTIKEDINKMALELSKNEILKNDFIANVSHELKTPLSVIQSYAKALENNSLSVDERKKYINNLADACKRLSNLITNILRLNKLENQNLIHEFTKFNLSELLANQIVQFEEIIEKKNLELVVNIEEDLFLTSEESYLELVFNNLISNAIKFTDNGKISISLKKNNDSFIIEFSDTGCGMDNETGIHIFDKFYQGDTSHSKEGNGLGLALVKRVIDIIGGSISVSSELNVGTTFKIVVKELKNE